MPTVTVDVEVEVSDVIDQISDEDLLDELKNRGLTIGRKEPAPRKAAVITTDLLQDALADLMTKRYTQRGIDTMREAIAALVPLSLLAAYEAAIEGRTADAVCELERAIKPSEAATATALPVRNVHESVDVMRGAV